MVISLHIFWSDVKGPLAILLARIYLNPRAEDRYVGWVCASARLKLCCAPIGISRRRKTSSSKKENLAHYDAKASRGQRCCGLTDGWVLVRSQGQTFAKLLARIHLNSLVED